MMESPLTKVPYTVPLLFSDAEGTTSICGPGDGMEAVGRPDSNARVVYALKGRGEFEAGQDLMKPAAIV